MINLDTMTELYQAIDDTQPGSITRFYTLRKRFPAVSKADFDGFFAQAHRTGEIQMHSAEHPGLLRPHEKAAYVEADGTYYTYFTR